MAVGSRYRHVYQQKFLKLANKLFKFFLPLEFSPALVAKYWGAVYALLEVNTCRHVLSSIDIDAFLKCRDQDCDDFFTDDSFGPRGDGY